MTPELVTHVQGQEGCKLYPYLCVAGYPTIGWGHRIQSMLHPRIIQPEADALLDIDLGIAERGALALCPNLELDNRRLAALTDLVFNVGRDALDGVSHSDLSDDAGVIKFLRAGDWVNAAVRFRKWDHAKVHGILVEVPALKRRREVGAQWIEQG